MKKSIALIAAATLFALPFVSSANQQPSKMDKMSAMSVDQRIAMHEDAIKMHQDAVDCLKSDKPKLDCAKNFKMSMEAMHKKYFPNRDMHNLKHCMMDMGNDK